MAKRLLWLTALLFLLSTSTTLAVQVQITRNQGVSFSQVNFASQANSPVGVATVNLLTLRHATGMQSGYLNIKVNNNWAIRNLAVLPENEFPYSHLSSEFALGVSAGSNVASLNAGILFSDQPLSSMSTTVTSSFPVGDTLISIGGMDPTDSGTSAPFSAPDTSASTLRSGSADTGGAPQLDHPNIEAAKNQCYPAAVANSLQFLENTTDLTILHEHKPGLKGDDSLVGQLDTTFNRTVTSRNSGSGVDVEPGIRGKLKYLAANGLADRIRTRHWGLSGDTNFSETINGKTATSSGQGTNINEGFDDIVAALDAGENCEAGYLWPGGGHAIDLIDAGYKDGSWYIVEASDLNQGSDSKGAGAEGVRTHTLTGWNDGYPNMNGGNRQIKFVMCQKYIPPSTPTGIVVPDEAIALFFPNVDLTRTTTVDPANHSCCVDLPPSKVGLDFKGGDVTLSGSASWLPITLDISAQGSLSGSNTATVAGFSNVRNSVTGTINAEGINAAITLGTQGELYNVPVTFNVVISPDEPWPWSSAPMPPAMAPAIRVNGFRHALTIAPGDPVSLNLSMVRGDQSGPADLWLVAEAGGQLLSYDLSSGSWISGLAPTYQGPLFDLPNTPLFSLPGGLPAGSYNFYFGVDMTPNGRLDARSLRYDHAALTVQ